MNILKIDEKCLILSIKTILVTGKEEKIEIKLNSIQKTKDQIIDDLRKYIKFLKGISGVKENIKRYYLGIDSLIIENNKQLNFLEECIRKKDENLEFKLLFRASKDDDLSSTFHKKLMLLPQL